MKQVHSVRSHHAAFWGLKFDAVAKFNESVRISPGTLSEAVVGRLGDLLEASRSHFWGLGGLSETSWGHLGSPWKVLGRPKRFSNDFEPILTPKVRSNLDQNSVKSITKIIKTFPTKSTCFQHLLLEILDQFLAENCMILA